MLKYNVFFQFRKGTDMDREIPIGWSPKVDNPWGTKQKRRSQNAKRAAAIEARKEYEEEHPQIGVKREEKAMRRQRKAERKTSILPSIPFQKKKGDDDEDVSVSNPELIKELKDALPMYGIKTNYRRSNLGRLIETLRRAVIREENLLDAANGRDYINDSRSYVQDDKKSPWDCIPSHLKVPVRNERYLLRVPDGLVDECPIRREKCIEPTIAHPCGHIFCKSEIADWENLHNSCPMCRNSEKLEPRVDDSKITVGTFSFSIHDVRIPEKVPVSSELDSAMKRWICNFVENDSD